MLAREPYGSWDLARDVHLFRSLERLGIPCVSGLALGRSDGTHPSYAPQRIGGCSSNGCDFPVCFLFQAAIAPLLAAIVIGMAWLSGILDPTSTGTHVTTNGLVIAMLIGTAVFVFVTTLTVSIIGFFEEI